MRRFIILAALLVTLALPATTTAARCHISGSGTKTICLCAVNGRFKSAPMGLCR